MKPTRLAIAVLAAVALTGISVMETTAIGPAAPVFRSRFVNAIPGMWRLDARFNDSGTFQNVPYGRSTGFRSRPQGDYVVSITTPKNQTTVIPGETISFAAGIDYTILATGSVSGNPALETTVIEVPREFIPKSEARLLPINTIPDGGDYDFVVDGAVVSTLGFREFDVPVIAPGVHTVELQQAGVTVAGPTRTRLPGGRTYTIIAFGTADTADDLPLLIRIFGSK
jgi:hypothetical protein